jgi:hypothetical protein
LTQHEFPHGTVRVAAARRVVEPTAFPVAIAGHGHASVADRGADPLEINALLLTSNERKCLLISFDLLYVGGPLEQQLRTELSGRHGLERRDVLLFASHTHFAPPTDPTLPALGPYDAAYAAKVAAAVAELAAELFAAPTTPCRLETRRGMLAHSVNRRRPRWAPTYSRSRGLSFDRVSFGRHESGPRDDTATLVKVTAAGSAATLAILWHYACHPVGRVPGNVTSADFPGIARRALRRVEGADVPVLYLQGFCGDIRPNIEQRPATNLKERLRNFAQALAAGMYETGASERGWEAWASSFDAGVTRIAASAPDIVEHPGGMSSAHASVRLQEFFEGSISRETLHLWGVRVGRQLELYAFGAEPSVEWQTRLSDALGSATGVRLYCAYCGDVFGYLPVPEQVAQGGYEVATFQQLFGMAGRFSAEGLRRSIGPALQSLASRVRTDAVGS